MKLAARIHYFFLSLLLQMPLAVSFAGSASLGHAYRRPIPLTSAHTPKHNTYNWGTLTTPTAPLAKSMTDAGRTTISTSPTLR